MTTADRMAVLDAGVLQQIGRPRELFDTPSNRFVAEFVGSTNLISGHYDATRSVFVTEGLGDIPLTTSVEGNALSIRPHALTIAAQRSARGIWFDGEVQESEFLGEFTRYQVRVGQALLTADSPHLSATPIYALVIACKSRSIQRKCEFSRNFQPEGDTSRCKWHHLDTYFQRHHHARRPDARFAVVAAESRSAAADAEFSKNGYEQGRQGLRGRAAAGAKQMFEAEDEQDARWRPPK